MIRSIIQLAEESHAPLNPVSFGLVCWEFHSNNKVSGVASCRESAPSVTGFVEGDSVGLMFRNLIPLARLQPDLMWLMTILLT